MAKAESKTILKAVSTVDSKLSSLPIEDGQLIFVYDKKKIVLDNHGIRTIYEQIQTIENEDQRKELLAPIDSFYFVIETSILWRYANGQWNQITTSPQEQIDRIVAEGTKQVKAVQDKGTEVLQSIPEDFTTQMETKLNKQHGIENKGKVLVIGEDGNVVPEEVASGGGDGIAIINTMSGESPLVIPDSAERVNKGFGLTGKTEQLNTRGVNLWRSDSTVIVSGTKYLMFDNPIQTGTYTLSAIFANDKSASESLFTFYNEQNQSIGGGTIKQGGRQSKTFTLTGKAVKVLFYASSGHDSSQGVATTIKEIQLETGNTATPYEPYTGGKPSPNPEYPQEILNAGRLNEDTGKYEVDVKVNGGNLFNKTNIKKGYYHGEIGENYGLTATIGYSYESDINIKAGTEITLSIRSNINTRSRLYAVDSNGIILYIYLDSSNNSADNSHTFTIPNGTRKILVSVLEISDSKDATITVNIGKTPIAYEPYKEQTLTITSDRPITKWDRLVEQGGEIGWLYNTDKYIVTGQESFETKPSYVMEETVDFSFMNNKRSGIREAADNFCNRLTYVDSVWSKHDVGFGISGAEVHIRLPLEAIGASSSDESAVIKTKFSEYLKKKYDEGGPFVFYHKSKTTEFVPLPQSEQNAIRALKTYYPTTVITADGGELDPDIKVTYTADTKNYIDNKFGKTINAMQTKLLELESRV